jgi:hypothetical protein
MRRTYFWLPVGAGWELKASWRPLLVCSVLWLLAGCVAPLSQRSLLLHRAQHIHVVRTGETLSQVARLHHTTVSRLCRVNRLRTPHRLTVGMRLQLPDATPSATTWLGRSARQDAAPDNLTASLRWPTEGTLTSPFGHRGRRAHDGIDIGAPLGSAVNAAADGEVMFAQAHGSYGNLVILRHSADLVTVYAHHAVNLVHVGQRVRCGQLIAKVGATGRATGPHLHFEVRRRTQPQNPLRYLPLPQRLTARSKGA